MNEISYTTLLIEEKSDGTFQRRITERSTSELPDHDVLIKVAYSSLNYKDALSASGHKGVSRNFPHTPGIDAAGQVVESRDPGFVAGQEVIVTSYDLGMGTSGGFGEYIKVPGDWIVPLPSGMSLKQSMILGTAGFTAGLALHKMIKMGQEPSQGAIVVTGASGAVGSLAVAMLSQKGFEVKASTGSAQAHDYLKGLGAAEVIDRAAVQDDSRRPLLRPQWAGGIDTVGGVTLATLLKACSREGNIAVCGLVGSPDLPTTVYPFILNGINILGVDSATCGMNLRKKVWKDLADTWAGNVDMLEGLSTLTNLQELSDTYIPQILEGKTQGRVVLEL